MADQPSDAHEYQINMQRAPIEFVPQRVVSLVPCLTESLFDLDLGARVIGITDSCVHPADRIQSIIRVGHPENPDIERILSLRPDLVLANDEENRRRDVEDLESAGLAVWVTGPRTVFDTLNLLWNLMDVFDHAVMIPRVREIERAYDYTQAASSASDPVPVFVPIAREPWITFNRATYANDIVRVCGGGNVFADHEQRYPHVTLEELVTAQPEIILLPDEPYGFTDTDVAFFRQLDIPAAQTGRVHLVDGSLITWYGTRTAYALRDLPGLFMGAE